MHQFACFNHEITDVSKIYLPAVSSATYYGRGVFTTIAVYNSKPFQWEKHWRRLVENAQTININLSEFTESEVKNSLSEIINQNNFQSGRARLTLYEEAASGNWKLENRRKTSLLITTADFRKISNNLRLTFSSYPINSKSLLTGVKSCNYLENLLVLEDAKAGGFDEAIRLNEKNEIVSAAMANVFWTRGKEIFTPSLETGALKGTTRSFVLENFPVIEKRFASDELKYADEIFLTSAGIGIAAAKSLEKRIFDNSAVFHKVRQLFDKLCVK